MSTPLSPGADTPHSPTPYLGFAIVGCGAAIAPLDFAVNVAFPAMTEAFALATADIRWVAVCYVITYGSLMLFCGVLGDRLGHLRVFRWGLVLSALALAPLHEVLPPMAVPPGLPSLREAVQLLHHPQ
jgi:MFS family permease